MNQKLHSLILATTSAQEITNNQVIQNLWSNYGQIIRVTLKGGNKESVVVKHVQLSRAEKREGNQSLSHRRKVKSYQVETNWYKEYSKLCNEKCRIPELLAVNSVEGNIVLVLEDLNSAGFSIRKNSVNWEEIKACLGWLAYFHATFLEEEPTGLWETGTYWHLETRPDELECLNDTQLKNAAAAIDNKLKTARFQTLVHGDAKLANFCFSKDALKVAAVDFQYVGKGVGMKDVAYFISSCLDESVMDELENKILDYYFTELRTAMALNEKNVNPDEIEKEWRSLYHWAWTDFFRFWKGWASGHWSKNSYSEKVKLKVISNLRSE